MSEFTHLELPSEDSMFVHASHMEQETQSTSLHTQVLQNTHSYKRETGAGNYTLSASIFHLPLVWNESEPIMDGNL